MADYLAVADFRTYASTPSGATATIQAAITGASRSLERYCGRVFVDGSTASRVYRARNFWCLDVDDMANTTVSVAADENADGTDGVADIYNRVTRVDAMVVDTSQII